MLNPIDFLPALIQYGDIAFNFLRKHLSEKQISEYLDYLHEPTTTHGEAFRRITQEHGQPEKVFFGLEALGRINALCSSIESPSEKALDPEKAVLVTFSALRAGMMIGAVVDDDDRESLIALAKHGAKFAGTVGKKDDDLTHFLVSMFEDFRIKNKRLPRNKEALALLARYANTRENPFIYMMDDESLLWGNSGTTKISTLRNRFTKVRKKITGAAKS